MPRRSAAEAQRTRESIVDRSVSLASIEGLEGLTIGRVAGEVGLSKAGVLGHFPTKEELQLAAAQRAFEIFREEVWQPAAALPAGRARLLAICDSWLSYLERDVFPGGCFVASASCEFDDRPGRVRDLIAGAQARWLKVLEAEARAAVRAGELSSSTDPADIAFALNATAMGVNQGLHLFADDQAPARGWRAMRATLPAPRARRRLSS
jgi:AcrR family transcriptional regulator